MDNEFWFGLGIGAVIITFLIIGLIEINVSDGIFNLGDGRRFVRVEAEQEEEDFSHCECIVSASSHNTREFEDYKEEDSNSPWWNDNWHRCYIRRRC